MTGDRLVFATITTVYLAIAVRWEERSLVKSFGERTAATSGECVGESCLTYSEIPPSVNSSVP